MLVECRDPRSMVGHYPPICYPGQGWILQQASAQQWVVGDKVIPGTEYSFVGTIPASEDRAAEKMTIRNFFVLPGGRMEKDMAGVDATVKNYRMLPYGVAQIQLLFDGSVALRDRDRIFAALIANNARLIDALCLKGTP